SDACNRTEAEAVGAEFIPWRRAPSRPDKAIESDYVRDWEGDAPLAGLYHLRDRLMFGPARDYAVDLRDELSQRPADCVVAAELLFGTMVGAEAARTRLALFAPNL